MCVYMYAYTWAIVWSLCLIRVTCMSEDYSLKQGRLLVVTPLRNDSPSNHYLPNSSSKRGALHETPIRYGLLIGPVFCRSCEGNHNCWVHVFNRQVQIKRHHFTAPLPVFQPLCSPPSSLSLRGCNMNISLMSTQQLLILMTSASKQPLHLPLPFAKRDVSDQG